MSDAPWAPLHILGEDLYETRKTRGDNYIYPPDVAPPRCPVCGAPYGTCVDNDGTFVPLRTTDVPIIEIPED